VGAISFYMLGTARAAALAHVELMGWTDAAWETAIAEQLALEHEIARVTLGQLSDVPADQTNASSVATGENKDEQAAHE
jgi:hypothetical protein